MDGRFLYPGLLLLAFGLSACDAEAPPRGARATVEPPALAAMLTVPLARAPEALPAPKSTREEVPAALDVPFVFADDPGEPSNKGRAVEPQPDQSPLPMTVEDLVSSRLCSTDMTTRLSAQLAAQVNCIAPGTFSRIDDIPNVHLNQAANPFLQSGAARALRKVAGDLPDQTFSVNSTWRSIVQQHVLKRWEGTCGIRIAADPGTSHHESGRAIDVPREVTKAWRHKLNERGWVWYCDETNKGRWAGCRDVPHHTYIRGRDIREISVKAFQILWNRAHPEDPLPETGTYGPMTARRIDMAPLAGFDTGTTCSAPLTLR